MVLAIDAPRAERSPAVPARTSAAAPRSPYLVSRAYDWGFFLLSPLLALALGIALSSTSFATAPIVFHGQVFSGASLAVGILVHAHLVAVFFRSHGNPTLFRRHRRRFLVVPLVTYALLVSSDWMLVTASVLVTFWDVYHSGLQTFGFARIYDARAGNPPDAGRRLDWWLNHLLYAGPILGGATMLDHVGDFDEFRSVGATFFTAVPVLMEGQKRLLSWGVVVAGSIFVAVYLIAWGRLWRRGHKVSFPKVFLLSTTGLCSVWTWGFNSFGMAFFIMNLFHAVQYLALVWWAERKNLYRIFSVERLRWRTPLAATLFLAATLSYGYLVQALNAGLTWLWAATLVVSLMHFWYDGFIWSVRAKEVKAS